MQVSVENVGELGRRLIIQIPSDEIRTAIQDRMGELSQKARVSGFRSGKIPKNVLEQKFGPQVRQEAVGKMIETSLPEALAKNALKPAGRPMVESISNDMEKDLQYVVSFEIFPEFTLADYSNIKVEKYKVDIQEKDIDAALKKLRHQFSEWKVVQRAAKESDRVTVDYSSTMNGKAYENNSGKNVLVEIGTNLFIEGFETGLIGAQAGDERILDLKFPNDWRIEKLAGKPVQFTVQIKEVAERKEAETDDAFAKKLGAASSSIEDIRQKIHESLAKQLREIVDTRLKDQITDALIKLNPIPLPKALVEKEAGTLHEEYHRRLGDKPQTACHHQGLHEQAEKRVALGLILNEVIKIEKLVADQNQIKERIGAISKMFGNGEFLESMYYESEELLSGVRHTVLLDQALELVISRATVIEKPITVSALLNRDEM